ncbi:MAG: FAD:protein FMN transferase [Gammaproteobacteria bacterium]|nr:FAD:protein FMN transferase [Gammaproteobacteria bacterium]MBU1776396.1 FAD:protein FMN transferase [Gammaproteobacteria bacterium]MBU1968091.1 FAD:protein FMN transferase [Gammaproteobacteria bacterium]
MSFFRVLALLLALLLSACGKEPFYQEQAYVFGTQVDVSIYGADEEKARQATVAVMHEFQRLHDMLHAWSPSELSELNAAIVQGKRKRVSPELAAMLQDAAQVSAQSGGTFNPAIGGLIKAWGFQAEEFKAELPDAKKIAALVKAKPRMSDLKISNPSQPPLVRGGADGSLPDKGGLGWVAVSSRNRAVKLDLGGYAKGYALDRAAAILNEQGIHNALINIGGNVMALGTHGTRPWVVGIQHPRRPGPIAILELHDGEAIGTSGDYQRYFELDGKRYCHLIDPRSGYPVQGVQAVTILTRGERAGLRSDSHSKPLFVSGEQGWLEAARSMQIGEALLIDGQGVVHLTANMQKRLKFTDESTPRKIEQ